jgi:chromosome segregation ATPase
MSHSIMFTVSWGKELILMQKKPLKVMESMLKEREEMLKQHEAKVISFKREFEKKLEALTRKEAALEAKEKTLKGLQKSSGSLQRKQARLESQCRKLANEEKIFREYVAKRSVEVGKLHADDARKRSEMAGIQKKLDSVRKEYDNVYQNADRITTSLKEREARLKKVTKALEEAVAKHNVITSQITYHSRNEIGYSLRLAQSDLKHGLYEKAREQYEKIRKFYTHLPLPEKKRVYSEIERLRARLSHPS